MRRLTVVIGGKYNLLKLSDDKIFILIDDILSNCGQNGTWISNRQNREKFCNKHGISPSYYHKLLNKLITRRFLVKLDLRGYYMVNKEYIERIER